MAKKNGRARKPQLKGTAKNPGGKAKRGSKPSAGKPPKAKARRPRAQALPGMEQVRDTTLDRLCENIGGARDEMNRLRGEQAGDSQLALTRMRARGLTSYRHAGVEMARVAGEEVLRIRTSKDKATAEVDEGGTAESDDEGGDQDVLGDERRDAIAEGE